MHDSFGFALRQMRREKRFTTFFIANLVLGLLGFTILDNMKRNFSRSLDESSRNMLTADLSVAARRPLTASESAKIMSLERASGTAAVQHRTLYSMAAFAGKTTLAELKAVGRGHPLYGWIKLRQGGTIDGSATGIHDQPVVWVAPEILVMLGAAPGDSISLGDRQFVIADVIEEESGMIWAGASVAPRIYMGLDYLAETRLLRKGSLAWYSWLVRLPPDTDVNATGTALRQDLADPAVNITTFSKAGQDSGRMVSYLSDYLGLVALVAFFLAGLGAAWLFNGYLRRKERDLAILFSLGMGRNTALLIYIWQLLAMGTVAALITFGLAALALPSASQLIATLSPVRLNLTAGSDTFLTTILLGSGGAVLICLPVLLRIRAMRPAWLFQEAGRPGSAIPLASWLAGIPVLISCWGLAVWQSHSIKVGTLFSLTLAGVVLLLGLSGWLLFALLKRAEHFPFLSLRLAVRYLSRYRINSLTAWLAIGTGAVLTNLIPQIQSALLNELRLPAGEQPPALFMFDIQDDQIDPLRRHLSDQQIGTPTASPMIRARLTAANGKEWKRTKNESFTRESAEASRFRNRGINLSWRKELATSEQITAGRNVRPRQKDDFTSPVEITLEERYAQRMGLQIGDSMTFELQSVPIETRIVGLRRVRWNSFQPNFFVQMQPGALDDAPKTWIVSIPALEQKRRMELQRSVVGSFPNVSIIDVTRLLSRVEELIIKMALILKVMAWMTLAAGSLVLFSIASYQVRSRMGDTNLLKVLGAGKGLVRSAMLVEFALLGFLASIPGSLLGIVAATVITKELFDGIAAFRWDTPVLVTLLMMTISLLTVLTAAGRILNRRAALYLKDDG